MASSNINEITLMAIESPTRTMSYEQVAKHLDIPVESVEVTLSSSSSKGDIIGSVDASTATLTIDGTPPTVVSSDLISRTLNDSSRFDALSSANVNEPPRHKKRNHSDIQ